MSLSTFSRNSMQRNFLFGSSWARPVIRLDNIHLYPVLPPTVVPFVSISDEPPSTQIDFRNISGDGTRNSTTKGIKTNTSNTQEPKQVGQVIQIINMFKANL